LKQAARPGPAAVFAYAAADDKALDGRLRALFERISAILLEANEAGDQSVQRFVSATTPDDVAEAGDACLVVVATPAMLADASWRALIARLMTLRRELGHGWRLHLVKIAAAPFALGESDPMAAALRAMPANLCAAYAPDMLIGDHGEAIAQSLADDIATAVQVTAKAANVVWRKGSVECVAGPALTIAGGYIVDVAYIGGARRALVAERDGALTTVNLGDLAATREAASRAAWTRKRLQTYAIAAIPGGADVLLAEDDAIVVRTLSGGDRRRLARCDGVVRALAVSPDGRIVVAAGESNNATAWSLANGACLATYDIGRSTAFAATVLGDNRSVLVGTGLGELLAFSGAASKPRLIAKLHEEDIWAVAAAGDDALLASGGLGGETVIAATSDCSERHRLQGHWGPISGLCFLGGIGGASCLASASYDGTLRIWDTDAGECLAAIAAPGPIHAIDRCVDTNGTTILAAGFAPGDDGTGPGFFAGFRISPAADR
jgi:hypothetical protein